MTCDWCSKAASHHLVRFKGDAWTEEELILCDRCYQNTRRDKPIILEKRIGGEKIRTNV